MFDLKGQIEKIERLVHFADPPHHAYAALECRLAIEAVCYYRLSTFHAALADDEMPVWTPHEVIRALEEIEPYAAKELTVDYAVGPPGEETVVADGDLDWKRLGKQSALDVRRLSRLWNALGKLGLHAKLPGAQHERVMIYHDEEPLLRKIAETIEILREISTGDILFGIPSARITATCNCGAKITRAQTALREGMKIACYKKGCDETYICRINKNEYIFQRDSSRFSCPSCGSVVYVAAKKLSLMKAGDTREILCEACNQRATIEAAFIVHHTNQDGEKVAEIVSGVTR